MPNNFRNFFNMLIKLKEKSETSEWNEIRKHQTLNSFQGRCGFNKPTLRSVRPLHFGGAAYSCDKLHLNSKWLKQNKSEHHLKSFIMWNSTETYVCEAVLSGIHYWRNAICPTLQFMCTTHFMQRKWRKKEQNFHVSHNEHTEVRWNDSFDVYN